jgi:hypothetical protein
MRIEYEHVSVVAKAKADSPMRQMEVALYTTIFFVVCGGREREREREK